MSFKLTRRQFLISALATLALPVAIESVVLEPHRLEVRRIKGVKNAHSSPVGFLVEG